MYTQTGSYIALSGVLVAILGHFGIIVSPDVLGTFITDVVKLAGDIAIFYGIIHQYFAHRNLAISTGKIPA